MFARRAHLDGDFGRYSAGPVHRFTEYVYKKAGIMLSEITPNSKRQEDLFAEAEPAGESKLMSVLD